MPRASQPGERLAVHDPLDEAGADAGLCHRGGIDVELQHRRAAGEHVGLEARRDVEHEGLPAAVHEVIDLATVDHRRRAELRGEQRSADAARELRAVVVDDSDVGVLDLRLDALGLGVDHHGERIDDEHEQHAIRSEAR